MVTPPPNSWRDKSSPYHAVQFRHDVERAVVVCPQSRELPLQRLREKNGRMVEVYRSAKVCKDCPVRAECTTDRHGRTIDIQPGHAALVAAHARWQQPATAELYGFRAATVEPVFAQIRQQMGFRRWSVRGSDNVGTQWVLLCTAWNLKVIYRNWKNRGKAPEGNPTTPSGGPKSGTNPVLADLFCSLPDDQDPMFALPCAAP